MLETIFANPGYLAAGGALISSPIIIHLINRMRFKRLRWAAMEFLLKAQKRNRRRLIIEQILLLLLRCMLVALLGLLVSRFVERSAAATGIEHEYTHIVLIDDTLSMNDQWRDKDDNNKLKSCLAVAKDMVSNKIIHAISRSSTNDRLVLVPLSKVFKREGKKKDKEEEKENEKEKERGFQPTIFQDLAYADKRAEVDKELADIVGTYLHIDMERGFTAVKDIVKTLPGGRVRVHVFSDLRASDWSAAEGGKKLQDELKALATWKRVDTESKTNELKIDELKVIVNDTAHPFRNAAARVAPQAHDNLAIVDFRAATRVAGKDMPVLFTVTIANYGVREAEVNVDVYDVSTGKAFLDIDFNPTMPIKVSPGSVTTATFDKRFAAKEGMDSYFIQLMAKLEDKRGQASDAIAEDNARYTTLEIRNKVPVLVIDQEGDRGQKDQQDSFFIRHAINSIPGESNTVVFGHELPGTGGLPAKALERADLSRYPAIFLLNIRELTDEQIKRLDKYVNDGGGVAFFLGPQVVGKFYREKLYKGGDGLFPVPLADTPHPPLGEEALKPSFTGEEQLLLRDDLFDFSMEKYPIFGHVFKEKADLRKALRDMPIKRYFKVLRDEMKHQAGKVFELATLPSDVPVVQYQKAALDIFKKLNEILAGPDYRFYALGVKRHEDVITRLVAPTSDKPAHQLAKALTDLLEDKGKKDDTARFPDLKDGLWASGDNPKIRSLRGEILQLRDQVKYGDPFVVLRHHGNGKVVAAMTSAGKEWNDWAGGSESSIFYQPFVWETLNYLQSAGQLNDVNRLVGETVRVTMDLEQYRQKGRELRLARFHHKWRKDEAAKAEKNYAEFLRKIEGLVERPFDKNYEPGIYMTHLLFEDDPDEARPLAVWAHAFNVNTAKESKLARVSKQELDAIWTDKEREAKDDEGLRIQGPDESDDAARGLQNEKPWDFSESPWLFLIFLGVLVAEQALAVHLSFHMRSEKGELPTVVVRPQTRAAA